MFLDMSNLYKVDVLLTKYYYFSSFFFRNTELKVELIPPLSDTVEAISQGIVTLASQGSIAHA